MKIFKKYVYIGLPILGVLFYMAYLQRSAIDMIYSDYIRLINSYLPDVWNPEKFFVADLLTRMPISYLGRAVNVTLFDYSVTFDRMLSVLSFGASAVIFGIYCRNMQIGLGWFTAMMMFMFSLNKWEMLYNSTGWCHFMAFACFFYNYLVLDRVYRNEGKKGDLTRLLLLPPFITVIVAGPYCAIYSMTLFISYGFIWIQNRVASQNRVGDRNRVASQDRVDDRNRVAAQNRIAGPGHMDVKNREKNRAGNSERTKARLLSRIFGGERCNLTDKQILVLVLSVLWPLLAFIWSDSKAVYEHSGAVDASMAATFFQQPEFFLKFFLKSFATMVFGVEFISRHMSTLPDMFWYLLGLVVLASYFMALWMNFHYEIYKKTIFPLMFLAGGGMNHLVVMVSRWIFLKESYGMSSRYALQYQIGILGIMLTFGLVYRKTSQARSMVVKIMALAISAMFVLGNAATTVDEYDFGQHRKNHNLEVREILLDFENQDEDTLKRSLEYSKPGKKEALRILKENGWNIFKEANE